MGEKERAQTDLKSMTEKLNEMDKKMRFDESLFKTTINKKDFDLRDTQAKLDQKELQYIHARTELAKAIDNVE